MKTLFLVAFSLALITGVYGIHMEFTPTSDVIALEKDGDKRTEVMQADLPQAVKDALNSDDYKGWVVEETVYLVTKKDGRGDYYEFSLKRPAGDETKTVKLDKEGNKVK